MVLNTKFQTEKHFNIKTKIGKLKIVIPLSELAKHDAYRGESCRSLQISEKQIQ